MINVVIAGLPGKMATLVVQRIYEHKGGQMMLHSKALTEVSGSTHFGLLQIDFVPLNKHEQELGRIMRDSVEQGMSMIVVDFTAPGAVNRNAELYCRYKIPFVMGTTGGCRTDLITTVERSETCAVIAPNMAAPIVAFQAMMAFAAQNFPGLFERYRLTIQESHQQGKADTSGTAKAIVEHFNDLGVPFKAEEILRERNPYSQELNWGIPHEYIDGHGWHTYSLLSPDATVFLQFKHNVNGREVYAQGTLAAIRFLAKKVQEGAKGKVFSMIDVISAKS